VLLVLAVEELAVKVVKPQLLELLTQVGEAAVMAEQAELQMEVQEL
jgi:hypothetical protein